MKAKMSLTDQIILKNNEYLLGQYTSFIGNGRYEFFNGWLENYSCRMLNKEDGLTMFYHKMDLFVLVLKLKYGRDIVEKLENYIFMMKIRDSER